MILMTYCKLRKNTEDVRAPIDLPRYDSRPYEHVTIMVKARRVESDNDTLLDEPFT